MASTPAAVAVARAITERQKVAAVAAAVRITEEQIRAGLEMKAATALPRVTAGLTIPLPVMAVAEVAQVTQQPEPPAATLLLMTL